MVVGSRLVPLIYERGKKTGMVLILGDRLIRCTGDGQLNIVAITIVRLADASSSSSAAATRPQPMTSHRTRA